MANQIAANYGYLSPGEAATETAAHLRKFWAPEMRAQFCDEADGDELSPVARAARALLAGDDTPG